MSPPDCGCSFKLQRRGLFWAVVKEPSGQPIGHRCEQGLRRGRRRAIRLHGVVSSQGVNARLRSLNSTGDYATPIPTTFQTAPPVDPHGSAFLKGKKIPNSGNPEALHTNPCGAAHNFGSDSLSMQFTGGPSRCQQHPQRPSWWRMKSQCRRAHASERAKAGD